jgi:hypothetical protein
MNIAWRIMSADDYAAFQRTQHETVVRVGDVLWKRVRPFFHRPLFVFEELDPGSVRPPGSAVIGGCQFAVSSAHQANSQLNLRIFTDVQDYSPDHLQENPRRQIRSAEKRLQIRAITDPEEFKNQAYPVYRSFYERTHYPFLAERRSRIGFARWADGLFRFSGNLVLGADRGGRLGAVGVTQLVDDTVFYSTFFCDDESLRMHAADLMLHVVRLAARERAEVRRIFAGLHKDGVGVDRFYLLRGCKVVRKPAWLELSRLSRFLLRVCLPSGYARLCGRLPNGDSMTAPNAASQTD